MYSSLSFGRRECIIESRYHVCIYTSPPPPTTSYGIELAVHRLGQSANRLTTGAKAHHLS